MKRVFRHGTTQKPINLNDYCKKIIAKYPDLIIHVGTDSQKKGRFVTYVCVVVFRYGTRGAHYIYHKEKVRSKKGAYATNEEIYVRLFKEAEMSLEVARFLEDNYVPVDAIELDFNSNENVASNQLIGPTVGMCKSYGFTVKVKPEEQMAVKAADNLVRK